MYPFDIYKLGDKRVYQIGQFFVLRKATFTNVAISRRDIVGYAIWGARVKWSTVTFLLLLFVLHCFDCAYSSSQCCILLYGTGAFWDLWIRSIAAIAERTPFSLTAWGSSPRHKTTSFRLARMRSIPNPTDTWRNNGAMITSSLRQNDVGDVVWTQWRRYYCVVCPLGRRVPGIFSYLHFTTICLTISM